MTDQGQHATWSVDIDYAIYQLRNSYRATLNDNIPIVSLGIEVL